MCVCVCGCMLFLLRIIYFWAHQCGVWMCGVPVWMRSSLPRVPLRSLSGCVEGRECGGAYMSQYGKSPVCQTKWTVGWQWTFRKEQMSVMIRVVCITLCVCVCMCVCACVCLRACMHMHECVYMYVCCIGKCMPASLTAASLILQGECDVFVRSRCISMWDRLHVCASSHQCNL